MPSRLSIVSRSLSSVAIRRAPVQPSGWPSAIAPPCGFSLFFVDAELAHDRQRLRGERLVQLDDVDVVELEVARAASALRDRLDRADAHDLRRDARDRHREHARLRRDAQLLRLLAPTSAPPPDAPSLSGLLLPAVTVPPAMKAGSSDGQRLQRGVAARALVGGQRSRHRAACTGTISLAKTPLSCAAMARWWLRSAKSSWSSRLMLYCLRQVLGGHAHRDVGLLERRSCVLPGRPQISMPCGLLISFGLKLGLKPPIGTRDMPRRRRRRRHRPCRA